MDVDPDWPHDDPELSSQSSSEEVSSSGASPNSVSSRSTAEDTQSSRMDTIDLTVETTLASKMRMSCEPIYHGTPEDRITDEQSESWLRRSPWVNGVRELSEVVVDTIVYRAAMTVELLDGAYLKIEKFVEREDVGIVMYGRWLLMACDSRLEPYIPRVRGELVWIGDETRPVYIDQVKRIRKIRFTNKRRRAWDNHEHLVCRLKLTTRTRQWLPGPNEQRDREPLGAEEIFIEYLSPDEADPELSSTNKSLREVWRGETTPLGTGR